MLTIAEVSYTLGKVYARLVLSDKWDMQHVTRENVKDLIKDLNEKAQESYSDIKIKYIEMKTIKDGIQKWFAKTEVSITELPDPTQIFILEFPLIPFMENNSILIRHGEENAEI